jgi:hypothetical protein
VRRALVAHRFPMTVMPFFERSDRFLEISERAANARLWLWAARQILLSSNGSDPDACACEGWYTTGTQNLLFLT